VGEDRRRYLNRKQDCHKCYVTVILVDMPCAPGCLHKKFWVTSGREDGRRSQLPQQTARSGVSALVGAG